MFIQYSTVKLLWNINKQQTFFYLSLSLDVKKYRVVVGEYDLSKPEGREQVRDVTAIKVHRGWTGDLATGCNFKVFIFLITLFILYDAHYTVVLNSQI